MKKILRFAPLSFLYLAAMTGVVYAEGTEPTFTFNTAVTPFSDLGKLLSNVLVILFAFAVLLSFLFIVIGGIQWITAGGDKIAAQSARDRITAAVVGLIIVVAAFALTLIITTLLGVNVFRGIPFQNFPAERVVF